VCAESVPNSANGVLRVTSFDYDDVPQPLTGPAGRWRSLHHGGCHGRQCAPRHAVERGAMEADVMRSQGNERHRDLNTTSARAEW